MTVAAYTTPSYKASTGAAVVPLPDVDAYNEYRGYRGSATQLANGKLRWDVVDAAQKRRFYLSWNQLDTTSAGVVATFMGLCVTTSSVLLTTPAGNEVNVKLDESSKEIQLTYYVGAGKKLYARANLTLREE